MLDEVTVIYKGLKLKVKGKFVKGKGSYSRDVPPEEDEFIIDEIYTPVKEYTLFDWGDRQEIERLCIEKLQK